jgi:signal peptidase II
MPGEGRVVREKLIGLPWVIAAALLTLAGDQASKYIVSHNLSQGESHPVVKGIFHITLVFNTGAAFGMLASGAGFFLVFGIAAALILLSLMPAALRSALTVRIAYALALGGIVGNIIDRLRFGYVVDFLDFRVWPVFNVADSAITVAAILLCVKLLIVQKSKCKSQN